MGMIDDMCCRLNEDLLAIGKWAENNRLLLNPIKSIVLPICRSELDTSNLPAIYLGNTSLQYIHKTKYLGFHINSTLTCTDHINNVVKNIYYVLRNLRVSSNFTPIETKRKLVLQLIVPLINYFAEVYSQLDSRSLQKLLVAFNNTTRYIYGISRYSSITSWRKMILGYDLVDHLRIRNLLFLHRLIHTQTPLYLHSKLLHGLSTRRMTLIIPEHKYLSSSRHFFVNAIKQWNALPNSIKLETRRNSFKKALLEHITANNQ